MLTDAEARKAVPRDRDYKLHDAGGLHLFLTGTGHRSWRYKYRFGGKERRLVFGSYPDVSLKRARELRDDAKRALWDGRDTGLETKRARLVRQEGHTDTFEQFAREWHATQVPRWSRSTPRTYSGRCNAISSGKSGYATIGMAALVLAVMFRLLQSFDL